MALDTRVQAGHYDRLKAPRSPLPAEGRAQPPNFNTQGNKGQSDIYGLVDIHGECVRERFGFRT